MKYYYSLILAVLAVLTLIAGILFSKKNYEQRFKQRFSLKNMFPFELNYESKFVDNILGNVFLVLSSAIFIAFYTTFEGSHSEGFAIFIFISGVFAGVLHIVLLFLPTKYIKTHIFFVTLTFAIDFMLTACTAILNFNYYRDSQNIFNLIGMIYSIVLCLGVFVLVMNPKLSFKIKGKEVKDEKTNEVILTRPDWIMIAFTEWVIPFITYANMFGVVFFLISVA